MPLPELPTEMIEKVIDQASNDAASLRQLSLLCKFLLTRARFHLFSAIVIQTVEQMDSSREFLDLHPWVPPLVRRVALAIYVPNDYSKPNVPGLEIIRLHLFTRLPNLRAWKMSTNMWLYPSQLRLSLHGSTTSCYRTYGRRIQNLELGNIRFQDVSHFVRLISAFTGLRSLSCSNITLAFKISQTWPRDLRIRDESASARSMARSLKIQQLSVSVPIAY